MKEKESIKAFDPTKGVVHLSPALDSHVALGHGGCRPGRGKVMLKNVLLRISSGSPSLAELC